MIEYECKGRELCHSETVWVPVFLGWSDLTIMQPLKKSIFTRLILFTGFNSPYCTHPLYWVHSPHKTHSLNRIQFALHDSFHFIGLTAFTQLSLQYSVLFFLIQFFCAKFLFILQDLILLYRTHYLYRTPILIELISSAQTDLLACVNYPRAAVLETFTPIICVTAAEHFNNVFCLSLCRYQQVLHFHSQETSTPLAVPCMH